MHASPSVEESNPFQCTEVVTGTSFTDRERELDDARSQIKAGNNIVVHGPRKIGKSTFLAELARRQSKEFDFVFLRLRGITDGDSMLRLMLKELLKVRSGTLNPPDPEISALITSNRLKLALVEMGSPGVEILIKDDLGTSGPEKMTTPERERHPVSRVEICSKCGRPLKWVERYGRFYCYTCKKYLRWRRKPKSESHFDQVDATDRRCPKCRQDLRYVHKFDDYYCEACNRYSNPRLKSRIVDRFHQSDIIEILDLPQKIAKSMDRKIVVMIDDFHELISLENPTILRHMKSQFDSHRDVSYVFSTGNWHSVHTLFEDKNGPLFRFAKTIELKKIPEESLATFIQDRFKSSEGDLSDKIAWRLAGICDGHPYYAQQLAHELFRISETPTQDDFDAALSKVISQNSLSYSTLWDSIRSPLHKRYLVALATEPGVPHGEDFVTRHHLRSRSHVQRAENQLTAKGILADGEIVDPLLVAWLRGMIPNP